MIMDDQKIIIVIKINCYLFHEIFKEDFGFYNNQRYTKDNI